MTYVIRWSFGMVTTSLGSSGVIRPPNSTDPSDLMDCKSDLSKVIGSELELTDPDLASSNLSVGSTASNRSDRCSSVFFVARSMDGITGVKSLRHIRCALDRSRLGACLKVLVQSFACAILNMAMATGSTSKFAAV